MPPLDANDWEVLEQTGRHVIMRAKELIRPGNHPDSCLEHQVRAAAAYDLNHNYGVAPDRIGVRITGFGQDLRFRIPGVVHLDVDERAELERLGDDHPRRKATAAVLLGAGNCDHYAAFSWAMLRDCLTDRYTVAMVSAAHPIPHRFTIAGLTSDFNSATLTDRMVAIDPWPAQATVVLVRDHFSCAPQASDFGASGLRWMSSKVCRGNGLPLDQFEATKVRFQMQHFIENSRSQHLLETNSNVRYPSDHPEARYYRFTSRT
ncbi:hypothetical protein HH212_24730 [Massilia forsythiae]|uniref:Uncharacterized protein n=1 Tax=Massilia forsythiae TaxID=2728020 RepID=A0A7Z2ZUL9_9BURK|nr:hypothetical protein [Massilia forsythiae]QJE02816.1 hypothetical protein HH212_24730 [Massilia forsythiae]